MLHHDGRHAMLESATVLVLCFISIYQHANCPKAASGWQQRLSGRTQEPPAAAPPALALAAARSLGPGGARGLTPQLEQARSTQCKVALMSKVVDNLGRPGELQRMQPKWHRAAAAGPPRAAERLACSATQASLLCPHASHAAW